MNTILTNFNYYTNLSNHLLINRKRFRENLAAFIIIKIKGNKLMSWKQHDTTTESLWWAGNSMIQLQKVYDEQGTAWYNYRKSMMSRKQHDTTTESLWWAGNSMIQLQKVYDEQGTAWYNYRKSMMSREQHDTTTESLWWAGNSMIQIQKVYQASSSASLTENYYCPAIVLTM